MKRMHCLACVALAYLQAQPPELPETITAHLKNTQLLHVEFTQTRTLAALSRPLKTTGRMVLSRDLGVIWQVRKPLRLTYVISPKGLLEMGPDGRAKVRTAKEVPVVAQMGHILQALLQGRWGALETHFTVHGKTKSGQWEITLAPRPQTAAFLKGVRVTGSHFIERIQIEEVSGDKMLLAFERPDPDEPLSAEEQRLLSFE